jgi:hypothetical protein
LSDEKKEQKRRETTLGTMHEGGNQARAAQRERERGGDDYRRDALRQTIGVKE